MRREIFVQEQGVGDRREEEEERGRGEGDRERRGKKIERGEGHIWDTANDDDPLHHHTNTVHDVI